MNRAWAFLIKVESDPWQKEPACTPKAQLAMVSILKLPQRSLSSTSWPDSAADLSAQHNSSLVAFMKVIMAFILPDVKIGVNVDLSTLHSSPLRERSCLFQI